MGEHLGFVDGFLARLAGPMSFRLFLQPLMAVIFAVRDGRKDAMEGKAPYFWALFTDPAHRREMAESGWKGVGKVFLLAIVLDLVFQYRAFDGMRPLGALAAGVVLALVPYLALRGPVNRLWPKK